MTTVTDLDLPVFASGPTWPVASLAEALAFLVPRMPALARDGAARRGSVAGVYGIEETPLPWDAR